MNDMCVCVCVHFPLRSVFYPLFKGSNKYVMKPEPDLVAMMEDTGRVFRLPCETQYKGAQDDALSSGVQGAS